MTSRRAPEGALAALACACANVAQVAIASATSNARPSRAERFAIIVCLLSRPVAIAATSARKTLAQLELPEFSCRRPRHALDHFVAIGQLPFRKAVLQQVRTEIVAQLRAVGQGAGFENDARQRPLGPLLVGDRDHRGLGDRRM